jgi:RNA-directed DNA polymerase
VLLVHGSAVIGSSWAYVAKQLAAHHTVHVMDRRGGGSQYWADRRRRTKPPLDNATLRLLKAQHGLCPLCGDYLLHTDREPDSPQQWEQWLTGTRKAITRQNLSLTAQRPDNIRLLHTSCHRQHTGARRDPVPLHL